MSEEIFRISRDIERARDLAEIANDRLNNIIKVLPKDKHYKILEEYYEIIIELITAIMYSEGYKTLSHVKGIEYVYRKNILTNNQAKIADTLRKIRHGIVYYGKKIGEEFLINNKEEILKIIKTLNKNVKEKISKFNQ